jgi:hypothetical protein
VRTLLRSFAGGEIAPDMFSRIEDIRYQTGLALAQNFVTLPHGPARSRPGTLDIGATKLGVAGKVRLLGFQASPVSTHIIEFGAGPTVSTGYFRFYTNGAPTSTTPPKR